MPFSESVQNIKYINNNISSKITLEDIAKQVLDGVQMPLGSFVYDIDDEDISITLTITDGGAVE